MADTPLLIADTQLETLEALRDSLQEIKRPIRTASSADELRANLETEEYGLVVVSGPDLFGLGTDGLHELIQAGEHTPELLLVADSDELEVATALLERGSGDYLARPFTANQLVAAAETGLVRYEVRRERLELEGRLDDVRRRFDEASDRQSQLVKTIDEKRGRIFEDLENENRELRDNLQAAIQESSREAAERLGIMEERLGDTQRECDRLHEECERLSEQLRIEREDHTQVLGEVQREAAETRRLLEEAQRLNDRLKGEQETKLQAVEDRAQVDGRELRNQLRLLEEARDGLQAQLEDLGGELVQARDARREAEEERRRLKDELLEKVSKLTEERDGERVEGEGLRRSYEDLQRAHAELEEGSQSRILELESSLETTRTQARQAKDDAERVRIRLERHLETKNTELRAMAEERSVLRGRIKTLDDDLQRFSRELTSKEEERDALLRDLEGRARRAEKAEREAELGRRRAEERHRTEAQNHERKISDRDREVQRLSRENKRLSEYLRTERANLAARLESSERRIQSLTAAKAMLNEEFGKRLEDQAGRLERLTRDHERIAGEQRAVVERLEAEVKSLKDSLSARAAEHEESLLVRERLERQLKEKDRLVGQLTLEARDLRRLLGREREEDEAPEALEEPAPGAGDVPAGADVTPAEAPPPEAPRAAVPHAFAPPKPPPPPAGGWGDPVPDDAPLPPGFAPVGDEPAGRRKPGDPEEAGVRPNPPGFEGPEGP